MSRRDELAWIRPGLVRLGFPRARAVGLWAAGRAVRGLGIALAIGLATPLTASAADATSPRVSLPQGALTGVAGEGGAAIFLGVPFAQPPIGDLRWRPPRPAHWTGERTAATPGPACLQSPLGWNDRDAARSSEDCLYLDVSTPRLDARARLPVMVWIHGGANWAGSGDGVVRSSLARQGVVMVSVQYRLGVFGFLSHPGLTREGGGASGNYALMDLIAALTWVRDNIAAFGGDPDNVTLFGQSAGSQDAGLVMLAPAARGLFTRGILTSGTPGFGFAPRTLAQNEAIGLELARAVGAPDDPVDGLVALRRADGRALLAAGKGLTAPIDDQGFIWTQAVVDGVVLPRAPEELLAEAPPASLVVGNNVREIGFFGDDPARVRAWLATRSDGPALAKVYGLDRNMAPRPDPLLGDVALRAATDRMFRCAGERVADLRAAAGAKVWRYELQLPGPGETEVGHNSALKFVFDGAPAAPMQAYWLNFARTGDPNGEGLAAWPTYGPARRYLVFAPEGPEARPGPASAACAYLTAP